ncbi:hypothetical protein [Bifidobacterium animalis]|uniref:hypothetical protein n=1 Tax=Bifidobacterium animalis TaxID=28025 RepID=UPI003F8E4A27
MTVITAGRTGYDDMGEPITGSPVAAVVDGCNIQPVTTAEQAMFTDADHVSHYKLVSPAGTADTIAKATTIQWHGMTFKTSSDPYEYVPPDHIGGHVETFLEQTNVTR